MTALHAASDAADGSRPAGYTYLRICGSGAYGVAWLVRDLSDRLLVLKQVRKNPESQCELDGLRRYCGMTHGHGNLIPILHIGEDAGCFFYTMPAADNLHDTLAEYLPDTLENRLKLRKIPPPEVRNIALGLLAGIEHLHRNNLVHRDIKPSNILFLEGVPCLADIGLVGMRGDHATLRGTHGFFPPELLRSDSRALYGDGYRPAFDLYALGKVLYCMLTGLDADNFPMFRLEGVDSQFSALNKIVQKLCDPNPAWRIARIEELRSALTTAESAPSAAENSSRKWRFPLAAAAALLLIAAFAALAVLLRPNAPPPAPPRPLPAPAPAPAPAPTPVRMAEKIAPDTVPAPPPAPVPVFAPTAEQLTAWRNALQKFDVSRMAELLNQGKFADIPRFPSHPPPLFECVLRNGPIEAIALLLQHGASLRDSRTGVGIVSLALQRGIRPDALKLLIAADRERGSLKANGRSALFAAAQYERTDAIRLLTQSGYPVDQQDGNGDTALHKAVSHGWSNSAAALLECGASPLLSNENGAMPLHVVDGRNSGRVAEMLLRKGAGVQTLTTDALSAFQLAVRRSRRPDLLDVLLRNGARPDAPDVNGITPLHDAAATGNETFVRLLLSRRVPVDAPDCRGMTPLHYAALYGRSKLIPLLAQSGAVLDRPDLRGRTPLEYALLRGETATVEEFRKRGANFAFRDHAGLGWDGGAIRNRAGVAAGEIPYPRIKTRPQPKVSRWGNNRCCPVERLATAVATGTPKEVQRVLSSAGAGINAPDFMWRLPLWTALIRHRGVEMLKTVLAAGANPAIPSVDGHSILRQAIRSEATAAEIELLLQYGADPDRVEPDGITARDRARARNRADLTVLFDFYCPVKTARP